jgi:hypothetical protein
MADEIWLDSDPHLLTSLPIAAIVAADVFRVFILFSRIV